jgi:hypothetical protein
LKKLKYFSLFNWKTDFKQRVGFNPSFLLQKMSAKQIVVQKPVLRREPNFLESPTTTPPRLSLIHPSQLENEKTPENVEQTEKIWDELVACIKHSPVDYSYNTFNNPSPEALTNEELTKLANGDFMDVVYSPIHKIEKNIFPFQFQNQNIFKK